MALIASAIEWPGYRANRVCKPEQEEMRQWIRSFVLDLTGLSIWDFRTTQA